MKRSIKKEKGMAKGMPSAVVLSVLIHAALFLLAGMLVVFTVVKKEEQKFEPPKAVERPKMKLKKPKVKVKKTSKPKPTTRIVTKMNSASMPDIQLPEMSGMGTGLAGGISGFDIMPDFSSESLFGGEQSIGNDFVGTFYDFKKDRSGRTLIMDPYKCIAELKKFVQKGWQPSSFGRYYRSPKKLYTTTFAIPSTPAIRAPEAFGEPEVEGYCFAVHYKGSLVHKEDITFRFWGHGDDLLVVRVDGKIVLNAPYPYENDGLSYDLPGITYPWKSTSSKSRSAWLGNHLAIVGDWITLKAGEPLDMEVLVAEAFGGLFQAMLAVEVKGEEYGKNPQRGGPTLPIFKTASLSLDQIESIREWLHTGDAVLTNNLVFCDYELPERTTPYYDLSTLPPKAPPLYKKPGAKDFRTWTFMDGRTLEAAFATLSGTTVVLNNEKGRQLKVPMDQLSSEDQLYVGLENPPSFQINFSKKSKTIPPPAPSPFGWGAYPIQASDFIFGARVKKTSTKPYPYELHVEFFAVGDEIDGDNYILFDRQKSTFIPSKENKGFLELYSDKPVRVKAEANQFSYPMRGGKYGGFLITITDNAGRIIEYKTSNEWLFKNLENLKNIPVGKHFDKRCIRVGPPRPSPVERRRGV